LTAANTILLRAAEEAAEAYRSLDGWSDEELAAHLAAVLAAEGIVTAPDVMAWRRQVQGLIDQRESATRAA